MQFTFELEEEEDGRWIAEVLEVPGVIAYGDTPPLAIANAKTLLYQVLADRIEHGEAISIIYAEAA